MNYEYLLLLRPTIIIPPLQMPHLPLLFLAEISRSGSRIRHTPERLPDIVAHILKTLRRLIVPDLSITTPERLNPGN